MQFVEYLQVDRKERPTLGPGPPFWPDTALLKHYFYEFCCCHRSEIKERQYFRRRIIYVDTNL